LQIRSPLTTCRLQPDVAPARGAIPSGEKRDAANEKWPPMLLAH
jgi:hypothetical protein